MRGLQSRNFYGTLSQTATSEFQKQAIPGPRIDDVQYRDNLSPILLIADDKNTVSHSQDITIPASPTPAPQESASKKLYWMLRRQIFFVQQRWFSFFSFLLLDNKSGGAFRAALLRWNGATVGGNCFVRGNLQIQDWFFNLSLGDDVFINAGCCLDTSAPITIGDRAQLAYQVTLITGGHEIGPHESRAGAHCPAPIHIGKGAWIGARAVILPGVTIGDGAVVAAGALVAKDVPPDTLVAGVPAKTLRVLEADE